MIGPTGAVRVMVATKPVDFRKGAEGLATLVRESMLADPFSGAVYVFRAKRADRIKLIFWDGTGLCLFAKRLEDGIFRWPKIEDGVMRLSAAQLYPAPNDREQFTVRQHFHRDTAALNDLRALTCAALAGKRVSIHARDGGDPSALVRYAAAPRFNPRPRKGATRVGA